MENIRTDLAIEAHEMCSKNNVEEAEVSGVTVTEKEDNGVYVTVIEIKNKKGERELGKPKGKYITIEAPQIKFSDEAQEHTCKIIAEQIRSLCHVTEDTKTLVVGLGNDMITPDALGPEVVSQLMVTNHIKTYMGELLDESFSSVCAIVTIVSLIDVITKHVNSVNACYCTLCKSIVHSLNDIACCIVILIDGFYSGTISLNYINCNLAACWHVRCVNRSLNIVGSSCCELAITI